MTYKPRLLPITPGLADRMAESPISWIDNPQPDTYGQTAVGHYGGWVVLIAAMGFNDRVILAEPDGTPHYGWCFPKGGAAHLAALVWDPNADGEPLGHIKAVAAVHTTNAVRVAGEVAPWWHPPMTMGVTYR